MVVINRICKKRIIGDIKLLKKEPLDFADAVPDETNMLVWYFLLKGPDDSYYEGGHYIGKILFPENYPFSPPDFMMLTPSGRFMVNQKICLSNSGYHANEWTPEWNIRSILLGFLSIMLDDTEHGISHIYEPISDRIKHAANSIKYNNENYNKLFKRFRFVDDNGQVIIEKKEDDPQIITESNIENKDNTQPEVPIINSDIKAKNKELCEIVKNCKKQIIEFEQKRHMTDEKYKKLK